MFLPPQADGNDERPVVAAGGNARKPWAQRVAEYEASLAAAGPTATPTPGSSPRERVLWRQRQSAASAAAAAAASGPAPGSEAAKRWFAGGAPINIIQDDTPANAAPNVGGRTTPNGEEQVHRPTFAGPPGTPPPSVSGEGATSRPNSAPAPTTTARGRLLQGLLPPVAPPPAVPAVETPSTVTDSQRVADLEAQVQTLNQVLGQLVGGLQGMLGGGGLLHKRSDDEDDDEVLEADGVVVDCEASPFIEGEDFIELPVIEKREGMSTLLDFARVPRRPDLPYPQHALPSITPRRSVACARTVACARSSARSGSSTSTERNTAFSTRPLPPPSRLFPLPLCSQSSSILHKRPSSACQRSRSCSIQAPVAST